MFSQKVVLGVAEADRANIKSPSTLLSTRVGLSHKESETLWEAERSCACFPHRAEVTPEMQGLHANSSSEGAERGPGR